jgi:hypothetical protein
MAPARPLTWLPLALSTVLAGCAYISDEDEKWRLDPDDDGVQIGDDCDDTNGDLAEEVTWFTDADGDGYGAAGTEETGCEAPAGSADNADDCDDADNSVFPEAPDAWYDGVDSNCLGDDDYDQDGDGYTNDVDCDDEDASRAPDESVAETYFNGVDDNCDNTDQDGDQDGDTYWASDYVERVEASGATPLAIPDGQAGDCWDDDSSVPDEQVVIDGFDDLTAADVNPGAAETWYDSADQDCGGYDDNGDSVPDDFDQDSDSFASLTHPNRSGATGSDCDDTAASVNPDATETWYDGVDADCGGEDDFDADGDLYQASAHGGDDCDDVDPAVNPGALDFWYDGVDQDCGGEDDYDADSDGDQSADWGGYDCDDNDVSISSLATETWYDGVDTDCDGGSDYDADGDGYDSSAELSGGLDCDDDNASANPGMTEVCDNGYDDDCDGSGDSSAGLCWLEGELEIGDADVTIQGVDSSSYVGRVVGIGGDVDGDGTDDWAIGNSNDDAGGSSAGAVYLDSIPTSGTSDLDGLGVVIWGALAGDRLGSSVVIGDFDGDGVDDLAAGASGRDDAGGSSGAVYLFLGPLASGRYSATTADDASVSGSGSSEQLGTKATLLGDQDGDGADELAAAGIGTSGGFVSIISGLSSGSASASSFPEISADSSGDNFAYSLDGTGDLDGDGVDDLLVGAPTVDFSGSSSAGAAYVFHGPLTANMSASDGEAFLGTSSAGYVGYEVSIGGDVDGDGYDDLLVGATGVSTGGSSHEGGAFLIHGPATSGGTIAASAAAALGSPMSGANCGRHVSAEGDIDGDGTADILVGCENASVAASYGGAVYLMYEAPSGAVDLSDSMAVFAGTQGNEYASTPYAIPDQNGDGYDEVAVGAPYYDSAWSSSNGRLGVFFGGSW